MAQSGMPLRAERVLRYVTAFCPSCHRERPETPLPEVARLGGYLAEVDGRVWLVRGCPRHGRVVTLYDESPEILAYLEQWTAPTKVHTPDVVGNYDPVPSAYARGLGEMQTQHTCILLEDITAGCNLRCPTCCPHRPRRLPAWVPGRAARPGGGLPAVRRLPPVHPPAPPQRRPGPDKEQAVARLSEQRVFTTLTMTAALGVNDDEIGAVVRHALETPYVGGVSIQPQFGSGRSGPMDERDRLTHTGVLARLGPQTDGLVTWRSLTALPCSHPHCCSVGYLIKNDAGEWRSLVEIVGHEQLKARLGLVSNTIADWQVPARLRGLVKESLLGLLSEQTSLTHPSTVDLWRNLCENCDLGIGTLLRLGRGGRARVREWLAHRIRRITVKPFMDNETMLEERLLQCCVHVGTRGDDGAHQCAPFCAVQAWPALAKTKLPETV